MGSDNQEARGIKLFGKIITFEEKNGTKQEEKQQQIGNNDVKSDPTVEKRPDKIIPCPRCKSMETKFCYFNNYNVNQPRHFCKGCQRYWTAGGALRNVPVGAGRRKSKPPGLGGGLVGLTGFSETYESSGVQRFDLDGLMVAAAVHGGFRYGFPVKRLRCHSDSQSC